MLISSANSHVLQQLKLLYESLPRTSPFRTELTAALTKGLPVQNAMQVFGFTYAQIKGKKGAPANHDLLHTIQAVPREPCSRHDFVSLFRVQQFWLEHCAPSIAPQNMTPYVEHCRQDLQPKGVLRSLQKLFIFSDGASKHFKNKKTLAVVGNLAKALGIVIVYYFWCSYHGKGRCDGHFAVGKCMHRRLVLQGELLIEARNFVEMNKRHLLNTEATLVDGLQTQQGECVLRGLIKKFDKVDFDPQLGDQVRF